jgi:hypothetical protein
MSKMQSKKHKFIVWTTIATGLIMAIIGIMYVFPRKYGQKKLTLESEISKKIEQIVNEIAQTSEKNKLNILGKHMHADAEKTIKLQILQAIEELANSKKYQLYSVNRYGQNFIKAVFNKEDENGIKQQIPILFWKNKNQMVIVEIP